jgi:alkylated DNA repair dioxygenase AlkB
MGFHSDGESGVQGTIASLSLGSTARMRFRPLPLKSQKWEKTAGNPKVVLRLELRHVRLVSTLICSRGEG